MFILRKNDTIAVFFLSFFLLAQKWMVVGQVGQLGAAALLVFAREISAFEQELALFRYQVKMENTVTETVQSKKTA